MPPVEKILIQNPQHKALVYNGSGARLRFLNSKRMRKEFDASQIASIMLRCAQTAAQLGDDEATGGYYREYLDYVDENVIEDNLGLIIRTHVLAARYEAESEKAFLEKLLKLWKNPKYEEDGSVLLVAREIVRIYLENPDYQKDFERFCPKALKRCLKIIKTIKLDEKLDELAADAVDFSKIGIENKLMVDSHVDISTVYATHLWSHKKNEQAKKELKSLQKTYRTNDFYDRFLAEIVIQILPKRMINELEIPVPDGKRSRRH